MLEVYSKNLENAVNEIAKLPGIGKRTALRLALHIIKSEKEDVTLLTERIKQLTDHTKQFPKDKSAARSLLKLVGQRRKLLKYLQRTNLELYRSFIKELGLRK